MQQTFISLIQKLSVNGKSFIACVEQIISFILPALMQLAFKLIAFLMDKLSFLFYFVAKYILLVVDIIFSYVQRLCGLNMDFSSLSGLFSPESDIVFNLLYTAKETITPIIQNLIGLAIFMIILFTMIALVKVQFDSLNSKKSMIMDVLKRSIKAFFLLLLTPMMAIFGIVGSNLLLQSLYRATNTSGSMSIGTQIFSASAATANNFRIYAEKGERIPVRCDFSKEKEVLEYYKDKLPTDNFTTYITGSNNLIYTTYAMFQKNEFIKYSEVDENVYYKVYDVNNSKSSSNFAAQKRIESYVEQYYVMADIVDFSIGAGNTLYVKTVEQMLDEIVKSKMSDAEKMTILYDLFRKYNISLYKSSVTEAALISFKNASPPSATDIFNVYKAHEWGAIGFVNNYVSKEGLRVQVEHFHVAGAKDEFDGAKFLITAQKTTGGGVTYFEPVHIGYVQHYNLGFYSDYLEPGSMVVAKGFMSQSKYPTALKIKNDKVISYRDDFMSVLLGIDNPGNAGKLGFNTTENKNIFQKIGAFFTMLFNPEDAIDGDVTVNLDAMSLTYNSKTTDYTQLEDGRMQLGYFMDYEDTKKVSLLTLFNSQKFNLLLMFAAPIILVKVAFISFLGLIQRSYDLFLIIIFYPTAVVTVPLEDNGYNNWMQTFMNKLFAAYGLILGLNFILMLFPIINQLQFFRQEDIARSKIAYKVCNMFFGGTILNMTTMLNTVTAILFELCAFTLLDTKKDGGGITELINSIMKTDGDLSSDVAENFGKVVKAISKGLKIAGKVLVFVGKMFPWSSSLMSAADGVSKVEAEARRRREWKDFANKLLPGGKIRERIAEKKALDKDKEKVDKARKKLEEKLKEEKEPPPDPGEEPKAPGEGASKEEQEKYEKEKKAYDEAKAKKDKFEKDRITGIESQFKELIAAEKEKTKALQDPKGNREAKQEEKSQNKQMGITDADAEGDDEDDKNERDGDDKDKDLSECEESYMSDDELESRRKELEKNMEKIDKVDLDSGQDNDRLKQLRRARERQQKELERIKREQQRRKDEGLTKKDKEENLKEFNELSKKAMSQELSPEEKQRFQALQLALKRSTKKGREEGMRKVEEAKKKQALENAHKKEVEEKKKEDRLLLINKDTTDEVVRQRVDDAIKENQKLQKQVADILAKHPEWNIKDIGDPTKLMEILKSKGASKKELEKAQAFLDSQETVANLNSLLVERTKMQERLNSEEEKKKEQEDRAQAGRTGKKHDKVKNEIMKEADEAKKKMPEIEKEIAELQKQMKDNPNDPMLQLKLTELENQRSKYQKALDRKDNWEKINNEETRKAYDEEQEAKKENDKYRKKAEKFLGSILKNTGEAYTDEDIKEWTEYFRNPKAVKQHIKRQQRMENQGGKSMTAGRGFLWGKERSRHKAQNQATNDLKKTAKKITDQNIYGLGVNSKTGERKTITEMTDEEIQAFIDSHYANKPLKGQDLERKLLLEDFMEQRRALGELGTIGARYQAEQKADKEGFKEYRKNHKGDY